MRAACRTDASCGQRPVSARQASASRRDRASVHPVSALHRERARVRLVSASPPEQASVLRDPVSGLAAAWIAAVR